MDNLKFIERFNIVIGEDASRPETMPVGITPEVRSAYARLKALSDFSSGLHQESDITAQGLEQLLEKVDRLRQVQGETSLPLAGQARQHNEGLELFISPKQWWSEFITTNDTFSQTRILLRLTLATLMFIDPEAVCRSLREFRSCLDVQQKRNDMLQRARSRFVCVPRVTCPSPVVMYRHSDPGALVLIRIVEMTETALYQTFYTRNGDEEAMRRFKLDYIDASQVVCCDVIQSLPEIFRPLLLPNEGEALSDEARQHIITELTSVITHNIVNYRVNEQAAQRVVDSCQNY